MHLTADERAQLRHYEGVIETAHRHFVAAAEALAEIRARRLYLQHHRTFEDYCKQRWGFGRVHGWRFVAAARVLADLRDEPLPQGNALPETEKQCRALTPLVPSDRRSAWAGAVESAGGKQPTAGQVREAAERVTKGLAAAVRAEEAAEEEAAALIDDAERRERVGRALRCLRKARRQLEPLEDCRAAVNTLGKLIDGLKE